MKSVPNSKRIKESAARTIIIQFAIMVKKEKFYIKIYIIIIIFCNVFKKETCKQKPHDIAKESHAKSRSNHPSGKYSDLGKKFYIKKSKIKSS